MRHASGFLFAGITSSVQARGDDGTVLEESLGRADRWKTATGRRGEFTGDVDSDKNLRPLCHHGRDSDWRTTSRKSIP